MSEPYLGEIRMFGFSFAPRNWNKCDGALLPIDQNQALYSILGTTYGGDGRTSFALPDLRGRAPLHVDSGFPLGQKSGEETHSLSLGEIPSHNHTLRATNTQADQVSPTGNLLASSAPGEVYASGSQLVDLVSGTVQNAGSSVGHQNMMPSLAVNFCIAVIGTFPPRN